MISRLFIVSLFSAALFSSCVTKKSTEKTDLEYPYQITTTVGMIADVIREVVGDRAKVTNIIGTGIDPHSYLPATTDIEDLSSADLIFYNGLHLEGKLGAILEKQANHKPVIAVSESLTDYDIIDDASESDPHLWMDISAWMKVTENITTQLSEFDPANAAAYRANSETYQKRLVELDQYARQSFASIPENQRVLVTAHDAFSYLGRAYKMEVRGIQGISTESKAGQRDITELVTFLVENNIPAIFIESSVPPRSVNAVIEGAKARGHSVKIGGSLFSDAMGPPNTYEGTYIGMLDHNITTITQALGGMTHRKGLNEKLSD